MDVDEEDHRQEEKPQDEAFKAPMAPPVKPVTPVAEKAKEKVEAAEPKTSSKSPAEIAFGGGSSKNAPLPYKEPPWAGLPPEEDSVYTLEEIKNGTIVGAHKLVGKSFFIIGRLPACDIQLEHPSLSRNHAILQFKAQDTTDKPSGFYLYDLESTHGSFHNKNRCFPKTYYRLRVGHALKFGLSTRFLILQGPQTDMEEESDLSVTELKALAAEKAKKKAEEEEKKRAESEPQSAGISWGITDDDEEEVEDSKKGTANPDEDEEMPDMEQNPFSVSDGQSNEKLYRDDPKKFLKEWFEREGYDDVDYVCTEKGFANFQVKVDLPIDVMGTGERVVVAEVNHKGKKKEAIVQCALEACRLLDKYGALKSSNSGHESSDVKRMKRWEQNDYYSSDEDEYLDRTKTIQDKREKRMKLAQQKSSNVEQQKVETFDTLSEKQSNILKEILEAEEDLRSAQDNLSNAKSLNKQELDLDDLDDYMEAISKTGKGETAAKEKISKLKLSINALKQDLAKINRLIEIARPAKLPDFKPATTSPASASKLGKFSGIMVGKRKGGGIGSTLRVLDPAVKKPQILSSVDAKISLNVDAKLFEDNHVSEPADRAPATISPISNETQNVNNISAPKQKVEEAVLESTASRKPDKPKRPVKLPEKPVRPIPGDEDAAMTHFEDEVWVPPSGQTGDGRTSLNEKYGY